MHKEYHASGPVYREIPYVQGTRHGLAKWYCEEGKLTETINYDMGEAGETKKVDEPLRILSVEIVRPQDTKKDLKEVLVGEAFVVKVTLESGCHVDCPSVTVRNTTSGEGTVVPTTQDKLSSDQRDNIICITTPVEVVHLWAALPVPTQLKAEP